MPAVARKSAYIEALLEGSSRGPAAVQPVTALKKKTEDEPVVMHGDVHNDEAGPPHTDGHIDTGPDKHDDGHIDQAH